MVLYPSYLDLLLVFLISQRDQFSGTPEGFCFWYPRPLAQNKTGEVAFLSNGSRACGWSPVRTVGSRTSPRWDLPRCFHILLTTSSLPCAPDPESGSSVHSFIPQAAMYVSDFSMTPFGSPTSSGLIQVHLPFQSQHILPTPLYSRLGF